MKLRTALAALVWTALLPVAAHAVPDAPVLPLTLTDVLRQVEKSYPKLLGADAERRAATAKRVTKQGAFDPTAYSGLDYIRFNSTSSRGKEASTTVSESGIELLTRSGLKLAAGARRNIGSVKSPLSGTGDIGELFVSAKLPLLRGRNLNEKSVGEQQATLGEPLADQNFALVRLNTLAAVSISYWDWAASAQKRTVSEELLRLATVRAAQVRRRAERGDLPKIDAVEADAEVQRRRGNLAKSERDLQKAAYKLAVYLWENGNGANSEELLSGARAPQIPAPAAFTNEHILEAHANAIVRRPEVRGIVLSQEIVRLDRDLARNDRRPQVDLVFSPGLDNGRRSVGETLKAGIAFSLPLYRREATGRLQEAERKLEKLTQEQTLLFQQIRTEVDDAVSAITTTQARITAAQAEAELTRQLENGERFRFERGDSTLFLLNQRERATAEAQARVIDVLAEYQQAVVLFRTAAAQL